ncbi:hypothetical protein ACSEON_16705 [Pseudomonas aeruginosa]|uniref:hypothetical protein n=1 Tax=Pseudomonas aeruginosa TaxID=287 RepID=UPI0013E03C3F|nr:hypothetical protein [Pseudomonas aeruginosa]
MYSYLMSIKRFDDLGGGIKPRLVGWKDASTFPGFCGHHDKKLFAPLEDEPFTGSPQQCFLLSYRAIVWEYYAKLRSNGSASMRVALAAQKSSSVQRQAMDINRQTDLGLRDMQVRKNKFDECLTAGSWGDLHGLLIEFDQLFPIQCSAAWSPLIDVYGEKLQVLDYSPRTPAGAALVSFAANGNSYFLLSWHKDSTAVASRLADSIDSLQKCDIAGTIAALLLLTSENCHLSPAWYESLSESNKDWVNLLAHPFPAFEFTPFNAGSKGFIENIGVKSYKRF